jgi:hypothetical protein
MKRRPRQILASALDYIDWATTIAVAAIVSAVGLSQDVSPQVLASATLLVLGVFALAAIRDRASAARLARKIDELPQTLVDVITNDQLNRNAHDVGLVGVLPQPCIMTGYRTLGPP